MKPLPSRFLLLGLNAAIVALAFACTAPDEGAASSDDALTGGLTNAKTCAVRDAYTAAPLEAFADVTKAQLPSAVTTTNPSSIARFSVANIGPVYVVEESSIMSFYDANGSLLAKAYVSGSSVSWYLPTGLAATCGSSAADAGPDGPQLPWSDAGIDPNGRDASATTCLSTAPIDQTKYPYSKANPPQPECMQSELTQLTDYYRQHEADADFTISKWKTAVSDVCGKCVFGDASAAWWTPILTENDQLAAVNRGGCIEVVSHDAACGRAYQQYQDCTLDACLVSCTTQAQFTACREDATVLTTSCKAAYDAVMSSCGSDKIGAYETACKGTTYTFEGPIREMCVTPPPQP